jgi:hypothetical protein
MRSSIRVLVPVVLLPWLLGCVSVAEHGAVLNERVSAGVARHQGDTERIIAALAEVERAALDAHWDALYARVESAYREKRGLGPEDALDADDRRRIAATSAAAYFEIRSAIDARAAELSARTRSNAEALIAMNGEVTRYLASARDLDAAERAVARRYGEMLGLDIEGLLGLAEELIAAR